MNIKQRIGKRIADSRRKAGLTMKQLAERTADIKPARIGNWETGARSPGPLEAKVLAEALGVSASYLLCLSDSPTSGADTQARVMPRVVPILSYEQALNPQGQAYAIFKNKFESTTDFDRVPLGKNLSHELGDDAFALIIEDESMEPEFSAGDVIVADPAIKPKPGSMVVASFGKQVQAIVRKFRELHNGFELSPLNSDWATHTVNKAADGSVIATIVEHRRVIT